VKPLIVPIIVLLCAAPGLGEDEQLDPVHAKKMAEGLALFKSKVRGILVQSCLDCHGGRRTRAKLDISSRATLLRGGADGAVIEPGGHARSRLYEMVAHTREPFMPHKLQKLPEKSIAAIAKWIDLGAPYDAPLVDRGGAGEKTGEEERTITDADRSWWAFRPLGGARPPESDDDWCRTPVDRFVLRRLVEKGLRPNGVADPRQLVRRVYLDLVGTPPPVEVVERFVQDPSPARYESIVDTLLTSPAHGERWARHWLDVARFAESHGFEHDYDRKFAFHYRDFVIRALNQDMPYDRFVRWQLAGDELAPDEPLAMMATGFLGAGVFPTQITKKEVERSRYDALDDMAATTGSAMLALTVGCARCHDHKYDPISMRDYYGLLSIFTTTVRSEIDLTMDPDGHESLLASFTKDHAPLVAERERFEKEELPARLVGWIERREREPKAPEHWTLLDITDLRSKGGATLTKLDDGSVLATGKNPNFDSYTFTARTDLIGITAVRLEALADKSLVKGGPGRAGNGNIGLGDFRVLAEPLRDDRKAVEARLTDPVATFQQNTTNLSIKASIDADKRTGWAVDPQFGKNHAAVFQTADDIGFEGGTRLTFTLEFNVNDHHNIGRARLSLSTRPRPVGLDGNPIPPDITATLAALDGSRTGPAVKRVGTLDEKRLGRLLEWYRGMDAKWRELDGAVREHLATKPKARTVKVQVTTEGRKPMRHHSQGKDFFDKTFFLRRGDPEQKVEEAEPSFPRVLMRGSEAASRWIQKPPSNATTSYRRRSLASWITDVEHGAGHLLARVIVNRLWQHHIGRGIVATPNDFGLQGERPTHPELLDWLASRLIDEGWRLRPIHKLLITSSVYLQGAERDEARDALDPDNVWCWRRSPRRLEAEALRDSMLSVTGSLDSTMFGAGTLDEGMRRRSIYFTVKRSRMIPTLQIFDAPESLTSIDARPTTTIAPQALLLMNNPQVRDYARRFAKTLSPHTQTSLASAVVMAYSRALSRPPTPRELGETLAFVTAQEKRYTDEKKSPARELALADFCQVLLGLNEFIYVY